jgi:hypothetical protein
MGNKSSINRAEKLKEWSVNALKERHIQKILFHGKRMLKVFQIWFFRLKMTSKSNGQSRKEAGYKEPPVYMEDFYLGLSFDRSMFLDNLSEEAYAENDNDFDGDVYDNYTAKIF